HPFLPPEPWSPPQNIVSVFGLAAAALVVVRHAGNLRRLLAGTENRLQESPAMMLFSKTLHVLALGLWFGSAAFFTLAGYLIFEEFKEDVAVAGGGDRDAGRLVAGGQGGRTAEAARREGRPRAEIPRPDRRPDRGRGTGAQRVHEMARLQPDAELRHARAGDDRDGAGGA